MLQGRLIEAATGVAATGVGVGGEKFVRLEAWEALKRRFWGVGGGQTQMQMHEIISYGDELPGGSV